MRMRKGLGLGGMVGILFLLALPVQAMTWKDVSDIDILGYVDVYSAWNLNAPNPPLIPLHVFEGADGSVASLNRTELVFEHPRWRVDLGYGPTDGVTNGGIGASTVNVQQMYIKWPVEVAGRKVQVDAGKFVTHMGFEVIESKDNWLYTRGMLFQFAIPYWHAGIRAVTWFNDTWWGHIAAVNGWNNLTSSHRTPTWCFQVGGKVGPQLSTVINYITGADAVAGTGNTAGKAVIGSVGASGSSRTSVLDLIATFDINESVSVGGNYDRGSTSAPGVSNGSYNGLALYGKLGKLWNDSSLKVRYENVNDPDLVLFGSTVVAATPGLTVSSVTVGYDVPVQKETTARLEYRMDSANQSLFPKQNTTEKSQNVITAALVTTF